MTRTETLLRRLNRLSKLRDNYHHRDSDWDLIHAMRITNCLHHVFYQLKRELIDDEPTKGIL